MVDKFENLENKSYHTTPYLWYTHTFFRLPACQSIFGSSMDITSYGQIHISILGNSLAPCLSHTFSYCEPAKIIVRTLWTGTKNYVNRCEPAWKFMRTGVIRKHTLVSVTLKNMNRCKPAKNIMWTGVNRRGKLCELVRTVVRTNWKSG